MGTVAEDHILILPYKGYYGIRPCIDFTLNGYYGIRDYGMRPYNLITLQGALRLKTI